MLLIVFDGVTGNLERRFSILKARRHDVGRNDEDWRPTKAAA